MIIFLIRCISLHYYPFFNWLTISFYFQSLYGNIPCLIFHDVDLIPLDARNIYGCSIEGPRHLSSNLKQFRFQLPYEGLFGGAIAVSTKIFEEINGFSNNYFGKRIA